MKQRIARNDQGWIGPIFSILIVPFAISCLILGALCIKIATKL